MWESVSRLRSTIAPILALVVLSLLGFGCALVDHTASLKYTPIQTEHRGAGTVYLARPDPPDLDKNSKGEFIIGPVRNMGGEWKAHVVTKDRPEDWIAISIKEQLEQGGMTVIPCEALPDSCPFGIEVACDRLWNIHTAKGAQGSRWRCYLKLRFMITRGGRIDEVVTIDAEGYGTGKMLEGVSEVSTACARAMQKAMEQILPHLFPKDESP